MSTFHAGKYYPLDSRSRVWKAGRFVDGVSAAGLLPEYRGLVEISDINNLQAVLDTKSDVGHHHVPADISPEPIVQDDIIDCGVFY